IQSTVAHQKIQWPCQKESLFDDDDPVSCFDVPVPHAVDRCYELTSPSGTSFGSFCHFSSDSWFPKSLLYCSC
ncbi:MAG: hypothetical protein ACK53Y_02685, partial [bacterium]